MPKLDPSDPLTPPGSANNFNVPPPPPAGGFNTPPPLSGYVSPPPVCTSCGQQIDPSVTVAEFTEAVNNPGTVDVDEPWMKAYWRPAMAWLYMSVCLCDFILFPIAWSILQAYIHGAVQAQWNPITLQGAGLFHLAMGAILGVAAYGRTKEKINGISNV